MIASGRIWIGPRPATMASLGSKIEARRLACAADIPVIPGYDQSQDPHDLIQAAEQIGYPVLIKASAGGGGRGIRIVDDASQFEAALDQAQAEAKRAFGDSAVIVERSPATSKSRSPPTTMTMSSTSGPGNARYSAAIRSSSKRPPHPTCPTPHGRASKPPPWTSPGQQATTRSEQWNSWSTTRPATTSSWRSTPDYRSNTQSPS